MNHKEESRNVVSEEEKLKYVTEQLLEGLDCLFVLVENLYKEENHSQQSDGTEKIYYPIGVPLLCFCFLDFLGRVDYIFRNGKDGNEDKSNRARFKNLLEKFIINNDKYREYSYSFKSDDLYDVRNDLVHSFGLKQNFDNGKPIFHFVGGSYVRDKDALRELKEKIAAANPSVDKINIITFDSFLEIIKKGLGLMFDEYQQLLLKEVQQQSPKLLLTHLDIVYRELKSTTRSYFGIMRP